MRRYPSAPKFGTLVRLPLVNVFITFSAVANARSTALRRVFVGALVALSMSTCLGLIGHAQSAGPNVNVLPIVLPTDPSNPASVFDAALIGDLYLNRQLEPAIAVSTRNPAHMLAFFNDYRAVDIQADPGLGEAQTGTLTLAWRYVQKFFARLVGKPTPNGKKELPAMAAAVQEAWIGGSRSYDGGETWSGMFHPGAPFDTTDASVNSPAHGLTAATDPVLAAGPCGKFVLAWLAFDRGGASKMLVSTYVDLNNVPGGDTIFYEDTKVLESANNAQWGYFLDKPAIAVDMHRGNPADPCGFNVYVSYTTFNGQSKDGKAQTKITLARSTNSGQTYSVTKLNQPYQQGQGTALAVDPRDGTPQTTGGGTLYIAFRHFNDPDTILVHKSNNFGQTFSGQPTNLLAGSATPTLQKYDQPTIATGDTTDPDHDLMFRSLAFPTIAVTGSGTVMVAWTERVGIDPSLTSSFRRPMATGSPRIVLMRSANGGNTWTDINGAANSRLAIDVGRRDEGTAEPPAGYGFLPQARDSGPQIQPYLSFGAGKLMMLYYESRGYMTRPPTEMILPADLTPSRNFATGIDRLFDVRAALLSPSTGTALGSAQVSQYPLKTFANLADGETLDDVLPVNSPCSPDDGTGLVPCERRVDRANKPTSRSGTSPFKGDYVGLTPAVAMVPRADGSGWRWAINASDVPARAFHGIFADNRNLVPPTELSTDPEWKRYASYTPPFTSQCSVNGGSRNTDVFVSRIDGDIVVTAPTTFANLQSIQRSFPIVVSSKSGTPRYFRLSFSSGGAVASFRQESNKDDELVLVHPYSSATRVVYVGDCSSGSCVAPGSPQPVSVLVTETNPPPPDGSGTDIGTIGTVTLNGDASNALVVPISNSELRNPDIGAPDIGAPDIGAPDIGAPDIGAPDIGAPDIGAPDIGASAPAEYESVQDITWTLTNTGNTTSAYTANIHIDNPEQYSQDYAFQLIIHRSGGFGDLDNCVSANHPQSRIISIIQNPDIGAPDIGAPDIGAPDIGAPDIGAVTFAMGPSDSPTSSSATGPAARMQLDVAAAQAPTNDGTLKAPKAPETVKVTLRAYQKSKTPAVIFDPSITLKQPAIAIKQQSKNNNNGVLEPLGVATQGADLTVASGTPTTPTVQAGGSVFVNAWTLQNVGNITATPGDGTINNSVYLSSDNTFGGEDDEPLGSAGVSGPLDPGETHEFGAFPVTIEAGTAAGTYYLFIVADDGSQSVTGEVNELSENNNVLLAAVVTVTAPNAAPIASDQSVATNEDTAKAITLAATDSNGDSLNFSIVAGPAFGSLSGSGANRTYTPAANYNGPDSFTFKANDGALDSNVATVSITVNAVNDAPVADVQSVSTSEDTAVGITLTASDIDSATLTFNRSNPSHGALTGTGPNLTYTPAANYNGPDSFTFTASDGSATSNTATVTIAVTSVNDAPVAVNQGVSTNEDTALAITLGASDGDSAPLSLSVVAGPGHGMLSGAAPNVIYTPAANYNGPDSFTFKANDGALDSNVATVSITVIAVNDAPVANSQTPSVVENTPTPITLTASDVEGSALTYSLLSQPTHGTLSGSAPNVTYTPQVNYEGPDSFTFRANDGSANSNTATVSITVTPGIDQYGFIGLLSPYQAPPKTGTLAGSNPIVWRYTLGGAVVDTSAEMPKVTFTKMNATNTNCTTPAGDQTPVPNSTYFENSDFPGNSSFQYNANTNTWQFNWQTGPPVTAGCWSIRVILPRTGQVNGPFPLRLAAK
jgi:VCBS repeat-containing protein